MLAHTGILAVISGVRVGPDGGAGGVPGRGRFLRFRTRCFPSPQYVLRMYLGLLILTGILFTLLFDMGQVRPVSARASAEKSSAVGYVDDGVTRGKGMIDPPATHALG